MEMGMWLIRAIRMLNRKYSTPCSYHGNTVKIKFDTHADNNNNEDAYTHTNLHSHPSKIKVMLPEILETASTEQK